MELYIGKLLVYYPDQHSRDNIHYNCIVMDVKKRVKIRVFTPNGEIETWVNQSNLLDQMEIKHGNTEI